LRARQRVSAPCVRCARDTTCPAAKRSCFRHRLRAPSTTSPTASQRAVPARLPNAPAVRAAPPRRLGRAAAPQPRPAAPALCPIYASDPMLSACCSRATHYGGETAECVARAAASPALQL
jgi:hypothetical protein